METAGTSVCLVMKAVVISARWAGRTRQNWPDVPDRAPERSGWTGRNGTERQSHPRGMVEETRATNEHSPNADEGREFEDEFVWSADGMPGPRPVPFTPATVYSIKRTRSASRG